LAAWGNTPESLRQELNIVRSTAARIIDKLHALKRGEEDLHDASLEEMVGMQPIEDEA
jgi:hypothetical protein